MAIKKILIVGVGTMGQQIGFQCAMHGFETVMYNHRQQSLEACRQAHTAFAEMFTQQRGKKEAETTAALQRLSYTTDLEKACAEVDLVSESIVEDLEIKQKLYPLLSQYCPPSTILTTNTSTFLPSQIADSVANPGRFMAMHFVVGVWDANIAELMGHAGTSAETFAAVTDFSRTIGMVPVRIAKEQPGYIINSLLIPWSIAAQTLVTNGISSPADVDKTWMISTRMPVGPFGLMDMIGLGTVHAVLANLADSTGDEQHRINAAYLQEHFIDRGKLGMKTGEGYYHYPDPAYRTPGFLS